MYRVINVIMTLCMILSITNLTVTYGEASSMTFGVEHNCISISAVKYMKKCNITIEGNGYSSWLSGVNMNNKTFISMAIICIKDGKTQIRSIENPDEKYTFSGEQIVFMMGYTGYYYSNHESMPYITYNGTALDVLIIVI